MSPDVTPRPYDALIEPPLGGRVDKPRSRTGVTMVIDKGLGVSGTADLLDIAAPYIDYWKLPFGTSYFYPEDLLRKKISVIKSYGLDVYPGGTFLEIALIQGALEAYLDKSGDLGYTTIEVSDGTVPMTPIERRNAIIQARLRGFKVVSEVGKKDPGSKISYQVLHRDIEEDLAAGVEHILVEGRESGTNVGIYGAQGQIQEDELTKIVNGVRDLDVLIWEAPLKPQQQELIIRFGPNVNLGNVPPSETMALEALRNGMRGDILKNTLAERAMHGGEGEVRSDER